MMRHWLVKGLAHVIAKSREVGYDARHRVRTRGVVPVAELGLDDECVQYEGVVPRTLRKMIAALGPVDGYTFVDLGSGMGRAVLVASEFPFRRIVGVEIVPELHRIAIDNVRRYRGRQQCSEIELLRLDAADYKPEDENTVFFFYFPFRERLLTLVLANIERSLQQHPRQAFVAFVNPETAHVIDRSPAFRAFADNRYYRIWRSTGREDLAALGS